MKQAKVIIAVGPLKHWKKSHQRACLNASSVGLVDDAKMLASRAKAAEMVIDEGIKEANRRANIMRPQSDKSLPV